MYSNWYRRYLQNYRIISILISCLLVCVCIQRMSFHVLAQENENVEYVGNTTVTAYVMEAPQEIPEDTSNEEGNQTNSDGNNAKTGDTNKVPELILMLIFSMILMIAGMKNLVHN